MGWQGTAVEMRGIRGIVFDLDGTLIRGDRPLASAIEIVARLRQAGLRIVFCTQDTESEDTSIAARLNQIGFDADPEEIISCGAVVVGYLLANYSGMSVRLIGTELQRQLLSENGVTLANCAEVAHAVLIGLYPGFSANDLETACRAIWNGAALLAIAHDRTFPTNEGLLPATGALVRTIEHATRRRARILGKPSIHMAKSALKRLALPPEATLVIGDKVDVDVRMGKLAGCRTALVLSGCTSASDAARIPSRARPDVILADVTRLPELLRLELV